MAVKWISQIGTWERMMFKCNAFPLLDTYMKALTHEQNVKPIRGTEMKPIHLRDRKYMQIKTLANGDVVYFDGWNSGKPKDDWDYVVKWKENGEIHIQAPMYNCAYEQLTSLLGIDFTRQANKLWVHTHAMLPLRPAFARDPSILKWKDGRIEYTNPPTVTQKAVNRGVAKAVRGKYKRVYDYLRSMSKVHEPEYTYDEFMEAFESRLPEDRTSLIAGTIRDYWVVQRMVPKIEVQYGLKYQDDIVEMVSLANEGDLDMSHKLLLTCAWGAGIRDYWGSGISIRGCTPNKIVKAFDEFVLKMHREEVFYDKEVPVGKTPNQANNKYFN